MEEFVFSSNRQRWPYLRPIVMAAVIGGSVWLTTCCWALLKAPALPDLRLGMLPPTASPVPGRGARPAASLAKGLGLRPAVTEQ
jgi:hypothetical protein